MEELKIMESNSLTLIDNFFEDPDEVRSRGLSHLISQHHNIINDDFGFYPGIRTKDLKEIDVDIYDAIKSELEKYLQSKIEVDMSYHLTSEIHKTGLIHIDDGAEFAGLIYLNDYAPEDTGTILCDKIEDPCPLGNKFYNASTTQSFDEILDFARYKSVYNRKYFRINCTIQNKFNRFIMYDSRGYHAPHKYFGDNLFDSRLVLVFWLNRI